MNYKKILSGVPDELKNLEDKGKAASYIPELKNVDPNKLGINLITVNNKNYSLDEKFSIQIISKVLALIRAFKLDDSKLWERIGVEPSGTSFNSMI
jgi:glutaminase